MITQGESLDQSEREEGIGLKAEARPEKPAWFKRMQKTGRRQPLRGREFVWKICCDS